MFKGPRALFYWTKISARVHLYVLKIFYKKVNMKFFLVSLFLISFSAYAAPKIAIGGGLMINQNDTDVATGDADEELSASLNIGAKAVYEMNEAWSYRTGLYLQERSAKYSIDVSGIEGDLTMRVISASLPLNMQYKVNEKFSIFGGYTLDYNINAYCDADGDFKSCSINGQFEQLVHYVNLGGTIWANDKLDVDVSYQRAITDTYEDIQIHSLVAQLFYKFE